MGTLWQKTCLKHSGQASVSAWECFTDRITHITRTWKNNQNMEKEEKLLEQLAQNLTGDQMELVEEFHSAVCSTMATCELLAYRQGMRDMVSILSDK